MYDKSNGKQAIAIRIGLQTHVLKTCAVHNQLYLDDDVDPAGAFALAIELVRKHKAYVKQFHDNEHELTDLLSETLATTPMWCPDCRSPAMLGQGHLTDRRSFVQGALEVG